MKSLLTKNETEQLLDSAEDAAPNSTFVVSVREWFEENGFITDAQETVLNDIVNDE